MHANERNQGNKNKTKHVTFKLTTCSVVQFSPQTMVSLKMASLSDVRFKRKISCQQYIYVWLNMMPGQGANPVFYNKKNKD